MKDEWIDITEKIKFINFPWLDEYGKLVYPIAYKGKWIAQKYDSGEIEIVEFPGWKKGWDFKINFDKDGKIHFLMKKLK